MQILFYISLRGSIFYTDQIIRPYTALHRTRHYCT